MSAPREEVVRRLMRAASDGLLAHVEDATANELLSAYLTLSRVALQVAKDLGASPLVMQDAVLQLWLDCTDESSTQIN